MIESPHIEAAERKLLAELPTMVGALAVPELLVPYRTHKKKYESKYNLTADDYEFLIIQGMVDDLDSPERLDSLLPSEYSYTITPKPHNISNACLETRDAIGLGYKNKVGPSEFIGFAAAGINHDTGAIRIEQLKGIRSDAINPTAKHARNAIRWCETLVKAWAVVGAQLELENVEIAIYPATPESLRLSRMRDRHHRTAQYLGFKQVTNDLWRQSIATLKKPSQP